MINRKLEKHEIEALFHNPTMSLIVEAIKEIAKNEAEIRCRSINLRAPCEEIALQAAEFKGRQDCLHMLSTHETLIDFLYDYVVEDKPIEEVNIDG